MNNENLKPYKPGEQRAKENGIKGALKSNETKKQRKKAKEIIKILLNMEPGEQEKKEMLKKYNSIDPGEINYLALLIDKQIQKALKGDINAAKFLLDYSGEKPVEEIETETKLPITFIELADNSEVKREFEFYQAANELGVSYEEVKAQYEEEKAKQSKRY